MDMDKLITKFKIHKIHLPEFTPASSPNRYSNFFIYLFLTDVNKTTPSIAPFYKIGASTSRLIAAIL